MSVKRDMSTVLKGMPGVSKDIAKTLSSMCYAADTVRRCLESLADDNEIDDLSRLDAKTLASDILEISDHCAWEYSGGFVAQIVDELGRTAKEAKKEDFQEDDR